MIMNIQRVIGQGKQLLLRQFPFWKLFMVTFAVSFTCVVGVVMILPTKYESKMKILVSNAPQDLVISPNDGKLSSGLQDFVENRVNSEIQVMTSHDVLRDVVLRSGLAHEPGTISAAGQPSPWHMETAINSMVRHLDIQPVKHSDVLSVLYKARNPELATAVLRNLADSYMSMHSRAHAKPGSFTFFDDQARAFAAKLTESEAALQKFREGHPFEDPSQLAPLTQKSLEIEVSMDEAAAEASDSAARVRRARQQLAAIDPRIVSQVHSSPQAALSAQLTEHLAELENQKTQLLTKFLPNDRLVTQVHTEISEVQALLDKASANPLIETTTDINQIREAIEKDLQTNVTALAGLRARQESLAGALGGYRNRLAAVAAASTQHDQLIRTVQEYRDDYLMYSKEREEARIAASLDQNHITDVAIVEAPTFEPQPVSPNVWIDVAIGFLLSLMLAYLAVRLRNMMSEPARQSPTTAMAAA
ncbi:MAG TPA: hypothetical protein VNW54_10240 [Granulicella sp.]|jgi:uncharacterized protein involved in exopolysaccharide biosynthesis|nr:hypothetical protein [Granulicella sp.]